MAKSDDILKKYGITQVRGSEGSSKNAAPKTSTPKATGVSKADNILAKYGINQVRRSNSGSAQNWYDESSSLLSQAQQYFSDWHSKDDEGYRSLQDQIDSYISQGDYWYKQHSQDKDASSAIRDVLIALNSARSNTGKLRDYYGQWETADDYSSYLDWQKDYDEKSKYDTNAGQKEIDALEEELRKLRMEKAATGTNRAVGNSYIGSTYAAAQQKEPTYKAVNTDLNARPYAAGLQVYQAEREVDPTDLRISELEKQISQKKQYLNQAKHIQEGITLAGAAQNADFKQYNGYVSTKEDGAWDKLTSQYDMGYEDLTYEYINNQNGIRDEINRKHKIYSSNGGESVFEKNGYDHMNANEIAIYNYYYAKEGKEKAQEYLDNIQETLNQRKAAGIFSEMEGETAQELLFGIAAGFDQFASGMKNLVNTKDDYIAQTAYQIASGMVREDLADDGFKLPKWMGGSSIGQVGYDVITTSANMAPSILASTAIGLLNPTAGAAVGNALMGASAAGNAYQQALNEGFDKDQARGYSILVGASEMVMEKALGGISAVGGNALGKYFTKNIANADSALKMIAKRLGAGMISEFSEEYLQEVLDPFFQNLMLGTDHEVKLISAEALYAGILGALSAGVMEGPTAIGTEVKTYGTGKQLKKADISATRLAEIGKTFSADTVAYQLAGKVDENTGAYTMGRLFNEIGATLTEQNKADINNALVAEGMSSEHAEVHTEILEHIFEGGEVSDIQMRAIEKNDILSKVMKEVLIDSNSTVNQRTKGYTDALKALAHEKAASAGTATAAAENAPATDKVDAQKENGSEAAPASVEEQLKTVAESVVQNNAVGSAVFANENQRVVAESYANLETTTDNQVIVNMDEQSRNKLVAAYDPSAGMIPKAYVTGSNEAFYYGFEGIPLESMSKSSIAMSLSEKQRAFAYNLGVEAAARNVDTQSAAMDAAYGKAKEVLAGKGIAAKNGKVAVKKKTGGKAILDDGIIESKLTKQQKASYKLADTVAQAVGTNIHVYSGMTEYGKYDENTGEIWLNVNANISGQSMMAFTLGHELVHMAKQWSPKKFKAFADYLLGEYGKKGVAIDALIQEQIDNAQRNGVYLDPHAAYEEVIADACQRMLLDSDAVQKMATFKEKNPDLVDKIMKAIKDFIGKVRAYFKGAEPDSVEAQYYKELDEAAQKILENMFVDMVMDAGEHLSTIRNAFGKGTVVEVNEDGEFTLAKGKDATGSKFLYNDYTWERGGRDTLKAALKAEGFSKEDIDAALIIMDGKHELVKDLAKQFPEQNRINQATITTDLKDGHSVLSALVSNGDYPVNIDLLMVCKKRKAYQRVINRLCETGLIQQATVDALAIAEINKILGKYGFETACLGCFVESRRLRIQEWAETICSEWNAEVKKRNPNAKAFGFGKGEATLTPDEVMQLVGELESGGPKNEKGNLNLGQGSAVKRMGVLLDKVPSLQKTLSIEDLITPDGLTSLRSYDSNLFSMVKSRYGSNSPKFVQEFNPYNHELAKYGKVPSEYSSLREYLYAIGGARMQSFSDFIVENWFDYCQIVADLAARKLPMHTYTKEIALARLFGLTGIKINMSLIPDIDRSLGKEYAGLTRNADGELELIWADRDRFKATGGKSYMQSINFKDAMDLQNDPRYSANVGTIAIGVSDIQIRMMLNDPRIRMVIPYHSSGMNPIFADLMGTSYYKDYTMVQNTTVKQVYDSDGKKVSLDLDKTQTGKLTSGFQFNEVLQELGDARAAAEAYKEWCADASKHTITIKGKTYTAELTPKFNDFAGETNYYKLLEDFNTYDCISEQAAPQGDVQQIYPENFDKILTDELKAQEGHRQKQAANQAFDKAMGEIESFLKTHTKADTVFYAEQHGVKLGAKDKKLNAADKKKLAELRKGTKNSLPKVKDAEYLAAVKRGDMETAQKMVDEAAKAAGYTSPRLFHGTQQFGFTVPDTSKSDDGLSFFATDSVKVARTYSGADDHRQISDEAGDIDDIVDAYSDHVNDFVDLVNRTAGVYNFMDYDDKTFKQLCVRLQVGSLDYEGVEQKLSDYVDEIVHNLYENALSYDPDLMAEAFFESEEVEKIYEASGVLYDTLKAIADFDDGTAGNYQLYANTEGLFEIDAKGNRWNHIPFESSSGEYLVNTRRLAQHAKAEGYKGVKITNVFDDGGRSVHYQTEPATVYIFFDPQSQVKSADPVTYDESGNVIPLSERFNSKNKDIRYSLPKTPAPTFYSQMAKVVDGVKQEKLGAASVVSMLRGKGVKAEEIKWSGIEDWLSGKKSVTKAELQEFIAGSDLQIEEETLTNEEIPYTEDQQNRIAEHTAKRDEIAKELSDVWKSITGDEIPIRNFGAGLESSVESKIRDINLEHKKASFEGRLLEKLRKDLKEVIADNDDFGFDSWKEALISIHRNRKSFIDHYEMSSNDKAVIVKYCNALNAYNEVPNKISDADTDKLRSIAHEAELQNRKIGDVKSEHYAENAKHMTKWGQYKIKGGENYREILFKIPGSSYYNDAMAMHWEDRNGVLAHARIQDLNTFLGKMLFIEEIQSDWHNEGHSSGYRKATDKELKELEDQKKKLLAEKDSIMEEHDAFLKRYWEEDLSEDEYEKEQESYFKKIREINAAGRKVIDKLNDLRLGVPDAPFHNNYHEYVLKRLLREAAEKDYDSIGWTPAEIQVKRWSEEFAEGYRIEYDQDIPKFLNKYGKKWETKVGKTVLDNGTEVWSMAITDEMKDSVLYEGQPKYSLPKSNSPYSYERLISKPDMPIATVGGNVPNNRADLIRLAKQNAARVGTVDPKTGSVSVHVDDNGADVVLGTDGLKHGLQRGKRIGTDANSIVTANAGEIIKNSIQINEAIPKKAQATGTYVLIGAAKDQNGGLYVVRSMVNRFSNELASMDVLYAVNAKKEELAATKSPRSAAEPLSVTSSTISIANLFDIVNQHFPDILPEEVLKHYGYDARPEGDMGGNMLYKSHNTNSMSSRQLLADAFDELVQTPKERELMDQYRANISKVEDAQDRLTKVRGKIKSLTKAGGNEAQIAALNQTAGDLAKLIDSYDRKLLDMEASKPLRNVLERARSDAYQRAKVRGEENLAKYKQLVSERFDRGIENRNKTAVRKKIQNVVKELNDLLLNESKKRHVPDSLKKAVAGALSIVNMDTVGAEERAAKYAALIAKEQAKPEPDQDKIDSYTVSMENILRQGEKMGQRLKDLRDAYEEIQESTDPDIANAYDPVIAGAIKELSASIGDTSLRNMSIEQLSDVYDMYKMVLTRVRGANKALIENIKENISVLASGVIGEVRAAGGEHTYRAAALDPVRKFLWNNLKPVYAMEHIGSATLTKVFNNVRAGEDTWAKDVTEAREYYLDKSKKYGYDSWDFKKKYRFESNSGVPFELTLEQILSLYAYSKRNQAHDHLRLGGFVFDSNIETYTDKGSKLLKYKVNTADAHQITPEILGAIIGKLTPEQMGFVDEMQDYLSTVMGAKGNEVTSKMYGVKLFKEKFYFPLKSAKQFMFEQNEVSGEVKIKNSGFTNKVVAKANNPVILSNFMEVWSGHVNDMSMYHAFVLPLEDFNRVFNYNSPKKEGQAPVSVKGTIQNAYSPAAVNYVKNLITDLNGGARGDSTTGFINKMMGLFKKGSVFASLSVVIQQPSAIARAAALVDTKYFVGAKVDSKRHKLLWEELKQYAPVAIIKEMGYFDTNMGKSTEDFILGKEYSGFKEKMKALVTDSGYRDEVLSKAPALADELAWCGIWHAVKREIKDQNPGMDTKSEDFLQKCGERFTEVITKTQVYDSVLSRSANMRSKDTGMKMATAFMAEPTTSINMIADALLKGKRGNKKYARAAIGAVIASQIFNSILVSFVYAGRDDDEEKSYWEKYIESMTGNVWDSLNPMTYIPFIKDIMSIVQGYEVERSDMAVVSDLVKAWQSLSNDKVSVYRKVEGFAGSIAQIFGLPVKNIMRDVRGIYQTINSFMNGEQTTGAGIGYAVKAALPKWMAGGEASNQDQLYNAYVNGDKDQISRVKGRFKDQNAINSAIRKALRENDPRIREAAIAWNANDLDEYMRIAKQIIAEKHFVQDDVVMAIRSEASSLAPDDGETSTSKAKGLFTADKFAEAIAQGDQAMANSIRSDIIQTAQKNGKTAEEAEKSFESSAKSELKELFMAGTINESMTRNALVSFAGMEEEEADLQVQAYSWERQGLAGATMAAIREYNEHCAVVGVPKNIYLYIRKFSNNTENDVDEATGKTINYSAMKRVMAEIDAQHLTDAQKMAIARSLGWSEKNIQKYKPW